MSAALGQAHGSAEPRVLRDARPRGVPSSGAGEPSHPWSVPHSLDEALRALAAAHAQLRKSLHEQTSLRIDNERLMRSLETASRQAVAAQRVAHHDRLTGLPNRLFLIRRLQLAIDVACLARRKLAVLFIDLDGFKAVNDRLGHAVADRLLTAVGSRIAACIRSDDIACRYGGDEFVVLLRNLDDVTVTAGILNKIRNHVAESYMIDGREVRTSASMGLAVYPDDGERYDALLGHADAAMYRDKAARRSVSTLAPLACTDGMSDP